MVKTHKARIVIVYKLVMVCKLSDIKKALEIFLRLYKILIYSKFIIWLL
jgi:hypothetical protein